MNMGHLFLALVFLTIAIPLPVVIHAIISASYRKNTNQNFDEWS